MDYGSSRSDLSWTERLGLVRCRSHQVGTVRSWGALGAHTNEKWTDLRIRRTWPGTDLGLNGAPAKTLRMYGGKPCGCIVRSSHDRRRLGRPWGPSFGERSIAAPSPRPVAICRSTLPALPSLLNAPMRRGRAGLTAPSVAQMVCEDYTLGAKHPPPRDRRHRPAPGR